MNRMNRTLYLLPVVLLAMACGRADGHQAGRATSTATINRSWPASEIRQLRVQEVDGSVSVEAAETTEITLVATAKGNIEITKGVENDGLFETRLDGDVLTIGRKEHRRRSFEIPFLFDRSRREIHYLLRVPATVSLDISTVNGRIATRGMDGETEVATVNGTIDVETGGSHELYATTVNGRVRAKFLHDFQGAKFRTVNGGVEATLPNNASFNVDLSQVNGDFEASFPLNIHSNPGRRLVSGEVNGGRHELKVVTVNGDVELKQLDGSV